MTEVSFRVVSSPAEDSRGNPLKDLNQCIKDWRTADTKSKAEALGNLNKNAAGNFYRLECKPTAENGRLVLATAQALTEAGLIAEVQRLCSLASDVVKPGHRAATCFLAVAGAHADAIEGSFSDAAAKIDKCAKVLRKISSSDLSIDEAKLLLTEYTKLLGQVAREYSIHEWNIESLASRGQELIGLVSKWGLTHNHLGAGGYVALGLWKLAQASEAVGKPMNSIVGDPLATFYTVRSALSSWEKIGGSQEVLVSCCHLLAKFLLARERWSSTAYYLTKAQRLAEDSGDYIALGGIVLDQLHLQSVAPTGRGGQNVEDLVSALALIWAYFKEAELPSEVLSSFAFRCYLASVALGQEIISHTELDQVLLDTLERSASTDTPESAQSVLFSIASQDQNRLLCLLQAADARLPIDVDPSDTFSCLLSRVLDYLTILGTLHSDSCKAASEAVTALISKRAKDLRELYPDEADGAMKVELPRFHAALVGIARAAFQNPGALHLESEERLLVTIATNFRSGASRETSFMVVSRIASLIVMLNSKNPNWEKISRTASKVIASIEPFVVSNQFSESDVGIIKLAFFINAVALHKRGDTVGAAQSFDNHYAMVSRPDRTGLADSPQALRAKGIKRFERLLERKKLALFIYHANLSLHPETYSSEMEFDDSTED